MARILFPDLNTLANAMMNELARRTAPAQTCAHTYLPPVPSMIAPAMGGPASVATPDKVATMPKRTPIFRRSAVRLANAPKTIPCAAPLAMPKKTLKTYIPALFVTPTQAKSMHARTNSARINVLIGPRWRSAMWPTIGRSGIPAAFVIRSRDTASVAEKPMARRANALIFTGKLATHITLDTACRLACRNVIEITYVKETEVKCHEVQTHSNGEKQIRQLLESVQIDHWPRLSRKHTRLQEQVCDKRHN